MRMSSSIKKINHSKIYHMIYRESKGVSKQEIMCRLGLSLPTVTQKLEELQAEGLVQDAGAADSTGGRRARAFSIVKDARLAVGLDINQDYYTAVLVDLLGSVICSKRQRFPFSQSDDYYRQIGLAVLELIDSVNADHQRVLGVGMGVPGLITKDRERVFYGKILGFEGATCREFSKYIPFPCVFFNDAKAAGFAELWNRSDLTDAFYILLSQHVGGAMIRNHQVELGENTRAGEIGHMTMIPFGKACYCGRSGCLEPYCSSAVLSELAEGDLDLFFRSLRGGDPVKKSAWDEYLNILSMAVNNINMLLDCPVILGGSVGVYLEEFMGQLRSLARNRNSFSDSADYLACCQYKVEPIAAGAALPFIDEFIRTI